MKKVLKVTGKILLLMVCVFILFLLGVFIFHRVMLNKEKLLISEPLGVMTEVDSGNMCVYSKGSGGHTIVFMSGYGTPSPILDFKPLYDKLNGDMRIVVVEKFGYGFSDETDSPRDVDTMLSQTRKALKATGIEAPYILCPHSASGIEAMYWAQTYPEEIEGIAALDIAIPGYHEESGDSIFPDKMMRFLVNSGIFRLMPIESLDYAVSSDYLTDAEKEQYKALMYARRGSETMIHEAEWCKRNMQTISEKGAPDVPMLFFISMRQGKIQFPEHPEKYTQLYRDYTGGKQQYIELECGHCVHVEEPGFIASEILKFAGNLRSVQ